VGWPVHALAASAGVIYLVIVACGLGLRVIRSIELQEVLALGPTYDPVTRMASYSEAGKVTAAYFRSAGAAQVVGVMAISLANLPALENLHGRAAHNHALFVCASRLRNCAPAGAQLCRLGEDGFLMLMLLRSEEQLVLLTEVAHRIRRRLLRAIDLSLTGESPEAPHTEWTAELGIGIALSNAELAPGSAVAAARAASRSAWGFPSRIAVCEEAATGFMELPLDSRPR
jgi:GGDEF domain-containing protein